MSNAQPTLAAVIFEPQAPVDDLLREALQGYENAGVLGWLQGYENGDGCDCRDIVLRPLDGGESRKITQDLGSGATGCRLDNAALAEVAGWLEAELRAEKPALLVLNRFGKTEAEGGGLRGVLELAISEGVPVLVPVNRKQLVFWQDYVGELAQSLDCELGSVRAWLSEVLPQG